MIEGAEAAEGTVVIVDVYRAFTTEAVAFSRGAEKIILVSSAGEALDVRRRGLAELCMGEVAGIMPDGFDLGNSPFQASNADVRGRTLVHSTQAGTVGVTAARKAERVYAGSLVIARATAETVLSHRPELVTIVAMGDGGMARTDEDEQCAMYLKNLIQGRSPDLDAVKALVLAGEQSQKYDDPSLPHFHPKDREMAVEVDSVPFAIRVRDGGGAVGVEAGGG